jgi:hypothetical protein
VLDLLFVKLGFYLFYFIIYLFCNAEAQTQGLTHARQALYKRTIPPAQNSDSSLANYDFPFMGETVICSNVAQSFASCITYWTSVLTV